MNLPIDKQESIAHIVIKVLYSRFTSFPNDGGENRNAPFHEAFLNAFSNKLEGRVNNISDYISLSSWLQGLNTTLGQSFFEAVSHVLCDGEKKVFRENRIYISQNVKISDIIANLKNAEAEPNLRQEDSAIFSVADGELTNSDNFTADTFYETQDEIVAIELKSVRPNSGEIRGEKQKVLKAKCILHNKYPNKTIKYFLGFPFDPTSDTSCGSDKTRFLNYLVDGTRFLAQEEVLLADELWSYLSGYENTMQDLLDIINQIATPEFMNNYEYI